MKTGIIPGKIYKSSTDIKVWPIFVTKVEPNLITFYYMRDPDKLHTINFLETLYWSEIQ